MTSNILVTGAAGFIGGSVIADLSSQKDGVLKGAKVFAAVRSDDQAQVLAKAGIRVVQLDVNDDAAIQKCVLDNEIDIVLHTASSALPEHPTSFIRALGQRRQTTGRDVIYIHSGITALFTPEAGWPFGGVRDTDHDILEKERQIGTQNPVRATDIAVVDQTKAHNVKTFNVVIPMVYGVGNGEWKKISQNIPSQMRASLKNKLVRRFEQDAASTSVHISDLTALYALLVGKILQGQDLPCNEQGYYFAFAHRAPWHETMHRLAQALYKRGLVTSPEPEVWPSYEVAAEQLGWPPQHARAMATNAGQLVAVHAYQELGWQPEWTEARYLDSMDDEIDGVLTHDKHQPTLYKALMKEN